MNDVWTFKIIPPPLIILNGENRNISLLMIG